jgi:hypothetical protein
MKAMRIEKLPDSMSRDLHNKKTKRYKYSQPRLSVPRPKSRFGFKKSFCDKSVLKRTRGTRRQTLPVLNHRLDLFER